MDVPPMRPVVARCSTGFLGAVGYECRKPWPDTCFVQAGTNGVVFGGERTYRTAFFEAFPRDPDCFLRGEGLTVPDAEEACWAKWQAVVACPGHEFVRRGRTDGYAYCKRCPYAGTVLGPLTRCSQCEAPTAYARDKEGQCWCEACEPDMPTALWPDWKVRMKAAEAAGPVTDEEAARSIATIAALMEVIAEKASEGSIPAPGSVGELLDALAPDTDE